MTLQHLLEAKSQFAKDGFTVIRGFVSREDVEKINCEVERYVVDVVPTLPPEAALYEIKGDPSTLKQLPRINEHDEFFQRLHRDPQMSELAARLLGCDVLLRDGQWYNKPPPVGRPTPAHQDGFYDKIDPIEMVNMWLALDPVDKQNGCIRYVVRSHKRGLREHARSNTLGFSQGLTDYGPEDRANEVAVCAEQGDLLVHHGLTIHRADGNASNRNRRAIGTVFYAAHVNKNHADADDYRRQLTRDLLREGKL